MKYYKRPVILVDQAGDERLVATKIVIAKNFFTRFLGLMGRKELAEDCAMMLLPCKSIHTLFMRFPIDVVYVGRDMRVLRIVKNMKPWRLNFGHRKAVCTLEFPARTLTFSPQELRFKE